MKHILFNMCSVGSKLFFVAVEGLMVKWNITIYLMIVIQMWRLRRKRYLSSAQHNKDAHVYQADGVQNLIEW